MADTHAHQSDLVYFTHTFGGGTSGAWYRLLPADCIEILAVGLIQTVALNGRSALDVARAALEEFVRARQRLGQPIPSMPPDDAPTEMAHQSCPPSPEGVTH